ncbi:MAG: hypothetical protein OXD47_05610 [Gammaproteobacteria bacterium]|nr:hypothetical protein [Gammaproteobacteria bacterium]MCY4281339.1 hypothetical protein [Gammaproteobacteria bacterium]MCY4338263.1 hypothetical protein [Gammaproteobacteria bacterium]
MHRLFWVECPKCGARWYAEWELRHSDVMLECFACDHKFRADEAEWLDERPAPPG